MLGMNKFSLKSCVGGEKVDRTIVQIVQTTDTNRLERESKEKLKRIQTEAWDF